ncbi:hypothetical protein RZE84_01130 [Mollicutes bacterium LVI A0075]|nr:hypothetical protein RZE84_01130 [Mollicutes bacterium LVI A0075]
MKKSLIEYFASLGTETSDGSYMFTNSIVLESEAELNIRNKKRKVVQISVIIMILIGIIYQLVAMYDEYRYYQRQDARFDNINNQLQESYGTDLNEIFDVEF